MTKQNWFWLLALLAISMLCNALFPLYHDEAYYWAWSRHLALSYYDHPPMIAYLIAGVNTLGHSPLVLRSVNLICLFGTGGAIYHLANNMFGSERIATRALWIFLLTPLAQIQMLITSPDSPMMLSWALTLYSAHQYLSNHKLKWALATGMFAGLCFLSKYTGILILPALFLYLLCNKDHRRCLRTPAPYLGVVAALLCALPVIFWNMQHHWISFGYQLHHGLGRSLHLNWLMLLTFFAAQFLIFNPLFLGMLLRWLQRAKMPFLMWTFAFPLGFFLCASLFRAQNIHWAGPAYISSAIMLAALIERNEAHRLYRIGIAISLALTLTLKWMALIPSTPQADIIKREAVTLPVIQKIQNLHIPITTVLSDSFRTAAMLEYYLPNEPHVSIVTPSDTANQYGLWSQRIRMQFKAGQLKNILYIGGPEAIPFLKQHFKHCQTQFVKTVPGIQDARDIRRTYTVMTCQSG